MLTKGLIIHKEVYNLVVLGALCKPSGIFLTGNRPSRVASVREAESYIVA